MFCRTTFSVFQCVKPGMYKDHFSALSFSNFHRDRKMYTLNSPCWIFSGMCLCNVLLKICTTKSETCTFHYCMSPQLYPYTKYARSWLVTRTKSAVMDRNSLFFLVIVLLQSLILLTFDSLHFDCIWAKRLLIQSDNMNCCVCIAITFACVM